MFMIIALLTSILITWIILNFTFRKWVTKPLKLVTKILETENTSLVSELKQCPGEYKQIATLFTEFVDQKKELLVAKLKAEESEMLKTAFLANMSHEIRTPMNGILGFVELLKEPKLSGEEQQEYIGIIAESGQRMLNIINDIISISKLEAGHTEVVITETNVNDQVRYIFTFFKPEAEKKGVEFNYKHGLPDLSSHILTDREKLYAILTNLVKNAVKFTNQGSIELGYEKTGRFLEFFVKDTGVGIRQDQQEIVFERFRQASESLSRHYEGAGLGLAISKAYVEILGGEIRVESELGKGSAFYFTIPFDPVNISANSSVSEKYNKWESLNINGLKILVAEDDPISDLFLRKLIRSFAKEVLKVGTGDEAVEACRKNPDIDLILMDIQMPGMDGYEATRQIRQFNTKVVILAQTALALKGEREIAIDAGCNDYLPKPISLGDFSRLIRKYFEEQD
jgi:signal transduction histidine kinase/ActR/RegA family two-component response regulator